MDSADILRFNEEVRPYLKMLSQANRAILDQDVSLHPIFVFHLEGVELGIELTNANEINGNWSVNASSLEEFVVKRLIEESNIKSFKEAYKDPESFFCLFVVGTDQSAQFIFVPHVLSGEN